MVKDVSSVLLAVLFVATALLASPARASEGTIGVLNMRKVISASDAGQKAQAVLEKRVRELQAKFKKDEDALKSLQAEIEKKRSVWNDEKMQEKAIEFRKMQRDLKAKQEDASLELKKMEEQQLAPIRKDLDKVIEKVAKQKGLLLILPSEVIMYADDSVNVTDAVIKALNASGK